MLFYCVKTKAEHPRANLGWVIGVAAGVTLMYMTTILLDLGLEWIFGLWLASSAALLWMVIRILKDPYSTDKTFDDYFYQDREGIRRNGKE